MCVFIIHNLGAIKFTDCLHTTLVLHPAQNYFIYMEMSLRLVKDCKFRPLVVTYDL